MFFLFATSFLIVCCADPYAEQPTEDLTSSKRSIPDTLFTFVDTVEIDVTYTLNDIYGTIRADDTRDDVYLVTGTDSLEELEVLVYGSNAEYILRYEGGVVDTVTFTNGEPDQGRPCCSRKEFKEWYKAVKEETLDDIPEMQIVCGAVGMGLCEASTYIWSLALCCYTGTGPAGYIQSTAYAKKDGLEVETLIP